MSLTLSEIHKRIIQASINEHFAEIPAREQEGKLREAVEFVVVMLGIKNNPDKVTVSLILNFMRTHFRHFTLNEFRLAFEMNILSEDEKKPQHYHNFNLEFITPVLRNYLKIKREALEAMQRIPVQKQLAEHKSKPEDYYNRLQAYIKTHNKLPDYWNWAAVYDFMEEAGMVNETDTELKEFKKKVREEVKTKATLAKMKAADALERMRIDEQFRPSQLAVVYKTEYVKQKLTQQ